MSKKQKNTSSVKPSNPFKVVLPVLIGLVVVLAATVVIAIVSTPKKSAKVDNPNDTFVTIGDYKVTNQKMYEVLKSQYGINKAVEMIDTALLADVEVSAEQRTEIIDKIIYGEDEELTDEEKALKKQVYENNLILSGYDTPEKVDAYELLVCKRTLKAQALYEDYMKNNDYAAEDYKAAYEELNPTEDSAYVIYITFASKEQGKKLLAEIGNVLGDSLKSNTTANYEGWEVANKKDLEASRDEVVAKRDEAAKAKAELEESKTAEGLTEEQIAEIEEKIDAKQAEIDQFDKEIKEYNDKIKLDAADIAQIYIDLYNYVNAYYAKDFDPSTYFDADGKLVAGKETLKVGVHYEIVGEGDARHIEFKKDALEALNKENPHYQFFFNEEDAAKLDEKSDVLTSTGKFSSTIMDLTAYGTADAKLKDVYTTEFKAMTTGGYFLAYKFGGTDAVEVPYDFTDKAEESKKPSAELLAQLKAHLVETKFNDDIETQMLLTFRQNNNVKFYDRFLNASYKAAYVYLYEKTLKLADYPEYAENKKTDKKLAFSYTVNGEEVKVEAQKLFEILADQYGPQSTVKLVNAYALLSNAKYNKVYDPYQDKIYDKETYSNIVSGFNYYNLLYGNLTTVKEYKYAFENGVFESYGFSKDYGWKNFIKDYLGEDDTQFLAAALSQSLAQQNYFVEKYDYEAIKTNMQKLYDEYFSLKALNLLVYVNYDNDGTPDEFKAEENAEQENWTALQIQLAEELVNFMYENKENFSDAEKDTTLEKQLTAVVKKYNEASYTDTTWGKYLRAGLKVKLDSGEYKSDKTVPTELLSKEFGVIYQTLEKSEDYKIGETTAYETPYDHGKVIDTEYGFYRVAITNAGKRIATGEKGKTSIEGLTKEVYQQYLDGTELQADVKTGLEYYFVGSINELYDSNQQNLLIAELRNSLTAQVAFTNAAYKDIYASMLECIEKNIEFAIKEAELEEE